MGDYEPYSPPHRGAVFGRNGHHYDRRDQDDSDNQARVKLHVPSFTGKEDPNAYIEWEEKCDKIFRIHGFSEAKRVDLAVMEFSGYALTWWNQLQDDRLLSGNNHIRSWNLMKEVMRRRFVPSYYERQVYKRLQGLTQGSRTVEEYYKEMEVLLIQTRTRESDEAKMARFLHGLNGEISDFVEMFPYDTLQDVVHQAIRVEKKNMRNGRTRALQGRTTTRSWQRAQQPYGSQFEGAPPRHPHASTASSPAIRNQDKRPSAIAGVSSAPPPEKSSTGSSDIQCQKCKGRSQISSECPSKRTMIINERGEWESEVTLKVAMMKWKRSNVGK